MNASLKTLLFSCRTVPLVMASDVPSPLVDHLPVDVAALRFHKQEMAFLENCFRENPDNKVIWQADHEVALVWRTPREPILTVMNLRLFCASRTVHSEK